MVICRLSYYSKGTVQIGNQMNCGKHKKEAKCPRHTGAPLVHLAREGKPALPPLSGRSSRKPAFSF